MLAEIEEKTAVLGQYQAGENKGIHQSNTYMLHAHFDPHPRVSLGLGQEEGRDVLQRKLSDEPMA